MTDDSRRLRQALAAMVYIHPCNCGDEIPAGACARCRAVRVLGFDPSDSLSVPPAVRDGSLSPGPSDDLNRLLWISEHLFQLVPTEVWRASGGDDGQGHYEGEYHAEQLRDELARLRAQHASDGGA